MNKELSIISYLGLHRKSVAWAGNETRSACFTAISQQKFIPHFQVSISEIKGIHILLD